MFTKSIFAFAAALVVSSASAAVAYENPENKIGDRFQFLEQVYQPIQGSRNVGRYVMPRQLASSIQYANEVPENKIGDRFPLLQQAYQLTGTSRSVGMYVAPRQVAASVQYANEAPENKIGDRFPLLEAQYAPQRALTRTTTARRELTNRTTR